MDWNGDGITDLLFGQRRGSINLYAGNGDGTLHFVGPVYDDEGNEIKTTYNSSPWLVDWNADGILDLLLTGYLVDEEHGGLLRVYPGVGDPRDTLLFDADYDDLTWLYDLRRSTAQTFDLDGDGDLDLVLGYETGEVFFAENTGTEAAPVYSTYSVLHCDDGLVNVYSRFAGSGRARPHVCDYDADGIPDLLVGCQNGWIYVFTGYLPEDGTGGVPSEELSLVIPEPLVSGSFGYHLSLPVGDVADLSVRSIDGSLAAFLTGIPGGEGTFRIPGSLPGVYRISAERAGRQAARLVVLL